VIAENIEAALAAHDADLANSFVDLARAKNIPLNDELSKRVSEASAVGRGVSQRAKAEATKQSILALPRQNWIASRSLSSGAHSRDPLARMTVTLTKTEQTDAEFSQRRC
jgi:hypothetical protein